MSASWSVMHSVSIQWLKRSSKSLDIGCTVQCCVSMHQRLVWFFEQSCWIVSNYSWWFEVCMGTVLVTVAPSRLQRGSKPTLHSLELRAFDCGDNLGVEVCERFVRIAWTWVVTVSVLCLHSCDIVSLLDACFALNCCCVNGGGLYFRSLAGFSCECLLIDVDWCRGFLVCNWIMLALKERVQSLRGWKLTALWRELSKYFTLSHLLLLLLRIIFIVMFSLYFISSTELEQAKHYYSRCTIHVLRF